MIVRPGVFMLVQALQQQVK